MVSLSPLWLGLEKHWTIELSPFYALNLVLGLEETFRPSRLEFLNLSNTDILDRMFLYSAGFPRHCRIFSRTSGLYLLAAGSTSQAATIENVPRCCEMSSPGSHPWWRTSDLLSQSTQSRTSLSFLYYTPPKCCRGLRTHLLTLVFLRDNFIAVVSFGTCCSGVRACLSYLLGVTLDKPLKLFQPVSWYGLILALYCKD